MQFFKKIPNVDFLGRRKLFYIISVVITVAGLIAAFVRGIEYGIDFAGGTEVALSFSKPVEIDQVRNAMETGGFRGTEVKSYGGPTQLLVRVENDERQGDADTTTSNATRTAERVKATLASAFRGNDVSILQSGYISPKIGSELRTQALLGIVISLVALLLFITIRYEFVLALGAIIAMIHDVLVTFSFVVICNGLFGLNLEMNQGMLAAFLTVVGFSINDTVINYDRVRENIKLHRGENLLRLINRSINETLSRTLLTGICVILVLLILLFFSGEVLRGFAFTMLIGLITGTYSSVYIASALAVDVMIARGRINPKEAKDFQEDVARGVARA